MVEGLPSREVLGGNGTSAASVTELNALFFPSDVGLVTGDWDLTGTAAVLSGWSTSSKDSCRPRSKS